LSTGDSVQAASTRQSDGYRPAQASDALSVPSSRDQRLSLETQPLSNVKGAASLTRGALLIASQVTRRFVGGSELWAAIGTWLIS
jgi:hypothetical protein